MRRKRSVWQEGGGKEEGGEGKEGSEYYYLVSIQYTMRRCRKTQDARRRRSEMEPLVGTTTCIIHVNPNASLMRGEDREGDRVRGDSPVNYDSYDTSHAANGASSAEKIQAD